MGTSHRAGEFFRSLRHAGRTQVHVEGVAPSTLHFLTAAIQERTGRSVLVIGRDTTRAQQVYDELCHLLCDGQVFQDVLFAPRTSVSPYIEVSADSRQMLDLLGTLGRLATGRPCRVLVTSAILTGLRLPAPEAVKAQCRTLHPGDEVDREAFLRYLTDAGYARVSSVYEEGAFAVRGSLVDLFSPGETFPVRLDFFGDFVEHISRFSLDSQLTTGRLEEAHILPATEVLDRSAAARRGRPALLEMADSQDFPTARLAELLDPLRGGELPAGAQALLPLLVESDAGIFDYLDPDRWVVLFDDRAAWEQALAKHVEREQNRYRAYRELGRLALPPDQLFRPPEAATLAAFTRVNAAPLDSESNLHFELPMQPPMAAVRTGESRLAEFERKTGSYRQMGYQVAVTAFETREAERLAHLLAGKNVTTRLEKSAFSWQRLTTDASFPGVRVFTAGLESGVDCADLGLYVVTDREVFEKRGRRRRSSEAGAAHREKLLALQEGEHVVHRDYGIGQFRGVVRRVMGAGEYTCLKVEYARGEILYVPIHNAGGVQKYIGSGGADPRLDRLGGATWQNRVSKAKKSARKLAFDLLELYAKRESTPGHAYGPGDEYFEEFEAAFPYEETPDQSRAIEEVLADMEKPRPMDRLVCGDVGFGKTEVAMRAAFKTILEGRQVAVLVPTTVLAEQHRISFAERFRNYPVSVDSLSRFKTGGSQKKVLQRLAAGTLDVVVGTHRLLSKDLQFKELGLLIIDEEHRFGVGHKEKLKAMRSQVDVLSMTATPIPRTMHMALSGIRDLSVIQTPPPGRLDIDSHLVTFDPDTIADALRFELEREGQVFFLHNRVDDIETVRDQLLELVPEARIIVAHGQMSEKKLEDAMVAFMNHQADVLLCTTIIESGLDIPRVNTLIVNNADRFGLAQLYQIRGRVGRSSRKAYAYFIVPPTSGMTGEARSRLATLAKFTAVGSGFQVANIDMELRGAGNILGGEQSGQVGAVGFDMYVHLLQEEVEKLKAEVAGPTRVETQVDIPEGGDIPEDYIGDRHQRLVFFRRIAGAENVEQLEQLRLELRDRFGPLPEPTATLLSVAELRVRGQALRLARIEAGPTHGKLDLSQADDRTLEAALGLVRVQPVPLKVKPPHTLIGDFTARELYRGIAVGRAFLDLLEEALEAARKS